jgi:hypothetical protein
MARRLAEGLYEDVVTRSLDADLAGIAPALPRSAISIQPMPM